MPAQAQFMIGVSPDLRDRLDALRIVRAESRAQVGRDILTRYVRNAENQQAGRLGRLHQLADRAGYPNWQTYVQHLTDKYGQKVPSLEELELGQYGVQLDGAPAATFSG